jgi:hypothetical protein
MPNIPCPHCGRQISDQSKRCLYCAHPLTAGASGDVDKRAKMLSAMYSAGVGLPPAPKASRIDRLKEEPLPVRILALAVLVPIGLIVPLPSVWRSIKALMRP